MRWLGQRALSLSAALLFPAVLALGADAPATYQGKPLVTWLDAMRHDLDPAYRRAAMEAVIRFGALALPPLAEMLKQNDDPDGLRIATIALIRTGPAGRATVAERLAREPQGPLLHVIDGIGQSGGWARAFVPHLRTLANSPQLSLIALRVLAQAETGLDTGTPESLVEGRWDGQGGSVFMTPLDCFVKDRFSSIRVGLSPPVGSVVRQVRLTFTSGWSNEVFWTPAKRLPDDGSGREQYEAFLPKINTLGLTTISYAIVAETNLGSTESVQVLAAISPTEEGCVMVGGHPVPAGYPSGKVPVMSKRRAK